jgi:hypothetical protein
MPVRRTHFRSGSGRLPSAFVTPKPAIFAGKKS